jgi:hypothetical protein
MKPASKPRIDRITSEEENEVKMSLEDIKAGDFKQSKNAKDIIAGLRSPDSEN